MAVPLVGELYAGSLGWVDITSDILDDHSGGITITRGQRSESARVDTGTCSFKLNNRNGQYSPRNPRSSYYGLIGRNTPVRFSLSLWSDTFTRTVAPGGLGTSDSGLVWSVGSPADWSVSAGKGTVAFNVANVTRTGVLTSSTIVDSDQLIDFTIPAVMTGASMVAGLVSRYLDFNNYYWLRLEFDVAGVVTVKLSKNVAGVVTDLGSTVVSGLTYSTGTTLRFRASTAGTKLAVKAWLASGVEPRDWQFTVSDSSLRQAGLVGIRAWLVGGNTNAPVPTLSFDNYKVRQPRFYGEVSSWPSRWDLTGNNVWVQVEAAGITRRLGQGAKPLRSPIYRTLSRYSPTSYWTLEDGSRSSTAASAVSNGLAGKASEVTFSADDSLPGASTTARLESVSSTISMNNRATAGATKWSTIFYFKLDALPASNIPLLVLSTTGTAMEMAFFISSTAYQWVGTNYAGATVFSQSTLFGSGAAPTNWIAFEVFAEQNGGNVDVVINWHAVGSDTFYTIVVGSLTYAGTVGNLSSIRFGPTALAPVNIGHVAAYSDEIPFVEDTFRQASNGYLGETAGTRIQRLCDEEGVRADVLPDVDDAQPLGRQKVDPFLTLLADAASVGGGMLYEARADLAISYRTRDSLYNKTALDLNYANKLISSPFEPVEDDDSTRNDVTVTRDGGSSARVILDTGALSVQSPPNGVGVYDESLTLNTYSDDQNADQAGWRVRLGTVDEARYPRVRVNLLGSAWTSDLVLTRKAIALDSGDLLTISNLPTWLPPGPVSLMVRGYTERLGNFGWDITWVATPGSVWTVAEADSNTRVDSESSTLTSGITSSATSISVTSDSLGLWTTDAADFPLSILVGGEQMTVTAISGTSSPQTFTVTRSANGITKSHSAGAAVNVAEPAYVPL